MPADEKSSDEKEKTTLIWHLAGGIGGGVFIFLIGTLFGMCLGRCRGREQRRWSIPPLADILSPCDQSELQPRNYENVLSISSHEYEALDKRDVSQKASGTHVNRRDYENTPVTMTTGVHHSSQTLDPTALTYT
ncbi:hypothetical protein C0Q70_15161 [Pomacea canaliculata]|uniref:Uncharacterized protein n=1 Tax=Pomacea canaliculata TaxID=400727 RepID=A0A2T7NU52_POMCA|nr:hypothetical protein C0Q70_15161 [Pomacea canaliculata]